MYKIALVSRDGYRDLFPLIVNKLKDCNFKFMPHFICHTHNDKQYLYEKYSIKEPIVLANAIKLLRKEIDNPLSIIENFSNKCDSIAMVRSLWSTMFEMNLNEKEIHYLAATHIIFWEKFLKENEIDCLIYERPSILSSAIAWLVCQQIGIKSIDFIDTSIDTMVITESWNGDYSKELGLKIQNLSMDKNSDSYKNAYQYVNNLSYNAKRPNEAILAEKLSNKKAKSIFRINKICKQYKLINSQSEYYINKTFLQYGISLIKYNYHSLWHLLFNQFDSKYNSENDNYILFPTHMLGEWSNHNWMGLSYLDQLVTIKYIAQCLPPFYKLYVKEHPSFFAEQSISFYRELKKIRCIKLISPFENNFNLIKNAKGICTLGSTMGFEAILLGKPVILLGNPWYRYLQGVKRVKSFEDLSLSFQNIDEIKKLDEIQKIRVVNALFKISFNGVKVPQPNALSKSNISNLAEGLIGYIQKSTLGKSENI